MPSLAMLPVLILLIGSSGGLDEKTVPELPADSDLVDQIALIVSQGGDARELIRAFPSESDTGQLARLRELDRAWWRERSAGHREHSEELLLTLAACGDDRSLDYLHQVFESYPSRRQPVAAAISLYATSHKRRPADWRLLVRSLPVLDDPETAELVVSTLGQFRQRGTNPYWQRQLILVGLQMPDSSGEYAIDLLKHWTERTDVASADNAQSTLALWQLWFSTEYPDLPAPNLPVDSAFSNYGFAELMELVSLKSVGEEGLAQGKQHFAKHCANCHRYGDEGELLGPDLTTVTGRLQDAQIIRSLLYPSYTIPEEYVTQVAVTVDGLAYSGLVREMGDEYVVLQANGEKVSIPREDIEEISTSAVSSMPDNLLNEFEPDEIVELFEYLRRGR